MSNLRLYIISLGLALLEGKQVQLQWKKARRCVFPLFRRTGLLGLYGNIH